MFKPLVILFKRNFVPKLISAKQKILIITTVIIIIVIIIIINNNNYNKNKREIYSFLT